MSTRERGILIGLALVLAAVVVFIVVNRTPGAEDQGGAGREGGRSGVM